MKRVKLTLYLVLVACLFVLQIGSVAPVAVDLGPFPAHAAVQAGPMLSIPSLIPAASNDTVAVPVSFTGNGNDISSIIYSVDYDQTWLTFDPTVPFSITLNVPPGFVGGCSYDLSDLDGEFDCYLLDPAEPMLPLPDQVVATIILRAGGAPGGTVAPVTFSLDPEVSFGNLYGEDVPGVAQGGSVWFPPPPDPPSDLAAVASCEWVSLLWSDNSNIEDGFKIFRQDCAFCSWIEIGSVSSNITSYLDQNVQPDSTYTYKVCAHNIGGEACSSEVPVTTNPIDACYQVFLPIGLNITVSYSTISGWVRDHIGSPVPLAVVSDLGKGVHTSSNADGSYALSDLIPDTYDLTVSKDGYVCTSTSVTVPPSASEVNFICVPDSAGNVISGRVLDTSSQPVEGVIIADPHQGHHAVTDSDGYYALVSLPAGNYHLVAYKVGYTCTGLFANPVGVPPSSFDKDFVCSWTPGCWDGVANGGFEGRYAWEIPATEYTAGYSTSLAHMGTSSMRTGIVKPWHNRYSYSSARQLVTIPSGATRAILRFFRFDVGESYYPGYLVDPATQLYGRSSLGGEIGLSPLSGGSDLQFVLILDSWDNIIGSLMWGLRDNPVWTYHQFDLRSYRGWTIKLYFGTYNNGWGGVSSMHVDDVSLEVCH